MKRDLWLLAALSAIALARPVQAAVDAMICLHCVRAVSDTTDFPRIVAKARRTTFSGYQSKLVFVGIDDHVRYAEWGPTGWTIEVVDSVTHAAGLAMDFDDLGRPIVCYHDDVGGIVFGKRTSSGWVLQTIFPALGVLGATSLAHTPGLSGIACVAGTGQLVYLQQVGDNPWTLEPVTPVPPGSGDPSLLLENTSRAIAWHDGSPGLLRFASDTAGDPAWLVQPVDPTPGAGHWASLVGHPGDYGIAYSDAPDHQLRYAHMIPGGWTFNIVDGLGARRAGPACGAVELGSGASGPVGIAYYDQGGGDLDYAQGNGPAWAHTWLAQEGDVGAMIACGIGPAGAADTVGIVYTSRPDGDLLYYERSSALAGVAPEPGLGGMHLTWRRDATHAGGTLRFVMPSRGAADVTIIDAQGRRVAQPLMRELEAGPIEVGWDGRGEGGQRVAAGVYFAHVSVPGASGSARGIVLR